MRKLYLCIPTEESEFFNLSKGYLLTVPVSKSIFLPYYNIRLFKALCLKTPPYAQY